MALSQDSEYFRDLLPGELVGWAESAQECANDGQDEYFERLPPWVIEFERSRHKQVLLHNHGHADQNTNEDTEQA